jgi:hypothetical protein
VFDLVTLASQYQADAEIFSELVYDAVRNWRKKTILAILLAAWWHRRMAPTEPTPNVSGIAGQSGERKAFCQKVRKIARRCARKLFNKQKLRDTFNDASASTIRKRLLEDKCSTMKSLLGDAQKLSTALEAIPGRQKNDPKLLLVIDEAASLVLGGNVLYVAFNRVWSCIRRIGGSDCSWNSTSWPLQL